MKTPYFSISRQAVVDQYHYMESFAHTVNYSAKTNYDIIPVLEEETDAGFSVHFEHALDKVSDPGNTTFFLSGTEEDKIKSLRERGVNTFVVDNEPDLQALLSWGRDRHDDVDVYVRLQRKENTVETGKHYVFGMSSDTVNNAVKALSNAEAFDDIGIHVHRKTQNVAEWRLRDELNDVLEETTLKTVTRMNAGGGFPVKYKNYQRDTMPGIKRRFDDLKAWAENHDMTLVIEPGRIIAGPPGKLHVTVKNVYGETVVVDASVFNVAMDTFAADTRLEIQEETDAENGDPYTVKGCTPDSLDIIRYKAYLTDPRPGETLTFSNATAYNYSSDFCDLPTPETVLRP